MHHAEQTAVYLSEEDWRGILAALRDARLRKLQAERDSANLPRRAEAMRAEAECIGSTIERLTAQITIEEP